MQVAVTTSPRSAARCPRRKAEKYPARTTYVVLAQCEHGPIAAVVCSNVEVWKDEAVRLQGAQFDNHFERFEYSSVENAKAAIEELALQVRDHFGVRLLHDMHLGKIFQADWPIVRDIFGRVRATGAI